jgi:hypothetical protein
MAKVLSRQRITEGALGACSLGILVAAMAAIDETVREEVVGALSGDVGNNLAMASASVQRTANTVIGAALEYSDMNTPLVFFSVVAVVLFVLMLRP